MNHGRKPPAVGASRCDVVKWTERQCIILPEGGVPPGLVVSDASFDLRHEGRRVALHHLQEAGLKLVEEVDPRIAPNRGTKIVERRRSRSRPVWTVSSVDSDRSQHPEEIRGVQPSLSSRRHER